VKIETTRNIQSHTEYVLRVQRGPNPDNSWRISRRYNDFVSLNKSLQISGIELSFPGKKFIGKFPENPSYNVVIKYIVVFSGNMRPDFIAERLVALQDYIGKAITYQCKHFTDAFLPISQIKS
jgi:PX domain-containing protein kinase-like protein